MDRHVKSGMMVVAGLVSGITLIAANPHLRKSFCRFANRLMDLMMKPTGANDALIVTKFNSQESTSPVISNTEVDIPLPSNSGSDSHADSDETSSTSSNQSDTAKDYQQNKTQESLHQSELPDISKKVIHQLETFDIFTETVVYHTKEDRENEDTSVYCKNLFLKDRKGKFYYFICREEKNILLRQLKYKLHAHRNFSFASAEEVVQRLNVQPGCITPFAFLSEDVPKDIVVAISRDLMFEKKLNFHPLHENYATRISFGHLLKLFGHLQRKLSIIDL